jgi:hypothetical protein
MLARDQPAILFRIFLTTFKPLKYTNNPRPPIRRSKTRLAMERLVLGLIAVIGLHIAFVVYMAGIRPVRQNDEITGVRPSAVIPGRIAGAREAPAPASETASSIKATDRVPSATAGVGSVARREMTSRRDAAVSRVAKTVPAFPARTSPGTKNPVMTFSDRVILYKAPVTAPSRVLAAAAPPISDSGNLKRKNNSLVAKLQWVYKKPWGLMKAVGSKLR